MGTQSEAPSCSMLAPPANSSGKPSGVESRLSLEGSACKQAEGLALEAPGCCLLIIYAADKETV